MARIQNVDYEAIPAKASAMRSIGEQLNQELVKIYQEITNLHNVWYGKRYHSLVTDFNAMIPQLNSMLELVIGEIPFTLETVANNYAKVDTGTTIVGANKTEPIKITDISIAADVGMRFLESEVTTTQQSVSNSFDSAKQIMDSFEGVFREVQWESEAADAFRSKFNQLKGSIVTSFENINSDFVKLMQQALDDMQSTESANTIQ